ncbi:SIMPL domain-containing protein [Jatrophihabitans sp. YIM 134969]
MPNETVVTVRGAFESKIAPERATVSLTVGFEGPDKGQVYGRTVEAANVVAGLARSLVDPERGPATWWASERLRTWSHRPWNQDGKQLPPVFHAAASIQVKFRDFDALARFVDDVGTRPGVAVDGIEWALTEARRRELERDARRRAVVDATGRAQDYATAAGLGSVVPVALADAGMLGDQSAPHGGPGAVAFARAASPKAGGDAESLDLQPEDVTVAASVDARFVASASAT